MSAGQQRSVEEIWRQADHGHSDLRGESSALTEHAQCKPRPLAHAVSLPQMGFTGIAIGAAMVSPAAAAMLVLTGFWLGSDRLFPSYRPASGPSVSS